MIRGWHLDRGFADIGYHKVIRRDGTIENGRDTHLIGAHARGKNRDSLGICLEGNFFHQYPTFEQMNACARIYHDFCRAYSRRLKVEFHRAIMNPCPGPLLDRADFLEVVYRACPFSEGE